MSFRAVADEVGLTAVGVAVAAYLAVQLRKRFKPVPRVPLIETPEHQALVADRDAAIGRLRKQVGDLVQDRSPR